MKHLSLAVASLAMLTGVAGAWAATGGSKVNWQSVSVSVPGPGGFYTGANAQILNTNCVTCHTAGFAERQPTLSLAAWTVEVTKMKKAFGAPLKDSDIPILAQAMFSRQAK
ncbi:MAG: sulfite--cytochrome C oxidoreductase subunit B [Acidocella sp.]|nr:sulfite--cytochrome C oxidoreductase subunit B [Acidocella sp.]